MESLVGKKVAACVEHAGAASVLVCVLDDAFPSKYCLAEIQEAIAKGRPIITIFDSNRFQWKDVGKPAWWSKRIPGEVIQKVFERGTVFFNSHPVYKTVAEKEFVDVMMKLLPNKITHVPLVAARHVRWRCLTAWVTLSFPQPCS